MKSDLRGYQDRSVTQFYERDELQAVLPMGAGKTAIALTAARELIDDVQRRHALVLAPKRVAEIVWPAELNEWYHLKDTTMAVVAGSPAERKRRLEKPAEIHVVGMDNIQWLCEQLEKLPDGDPMFDLLIVDESSRFKNPSSKRAKALMKLRPRFRQVWMLTGTPRPNGYEDQYRPLSLLTDNRLWGKSFDKWRRERFFPLDFNQRKWSIHPAHRDQTIADINSVSLTLGDEDMPELPELTTLTDYVTLPPEIMREYKRMERIAFAQIREKGIAAANMGVATGKLCQMTQGFLYVDGNEDVTWLHALKSDWLVELDDSLDEQLLIAYDFVEDLRVLKYLYPDMPHIGSGVGTREANLAIEAWNKGELRRLALHPASAGHGLNLQFGGSRLAFYGMPWSAEYYDQIIKRFHRPGQKRRCYVHHCLARDTVDLMKYDRVHNKMSQQAAFNSYLKRV